MLKLDWVLSLISQIAVFDYNGLVLLAAKDVAVVFCMTYCEQQGVCTGIPLEQCSFLMDREPVLKAGLDGGCLCLRLPLS